MLALPPVRMKVAFIRADDPAFAKLLGQQDQRSIRQVHGQIRILSHQFCQARQMVGTHSNHANALRRQRFHSCQRLGNPDATEHQMDALHQNRVGRHQWFAVATEKSNASGVISITLVGQRPRPQKSCLQADLGGEINVLLVTGGQLLVRFDAAHKPRVRKRLKK